MVFLNIITIIDSAPVTTRLQLIYLSYKEYWAVDTWTSRNKLDKWYVNLHNTANQNSDKGQSLLQQA